MMKLDKHLPDVLARSLGVRLPSRTERARWSPQLCYGRHDGPPAWNARRAAVLLLLIWDDPHWRLPLTQRPDTMSTHSGQVSFPGGVVEPGESFEEAAIRELDEELGTVPADLRLLGRLSPIYVYGSNFVVTPCVAASYASPKFDPNPSEVANLLQPTLVELLDPCRHSLRTMVRRSVTFNAPQIVVDDFSIWGATCMVLGELLSVLQFDEAYGS